MPPSNPLFDLGAEEGQVDGAEDQNDDQEGEAQSACVAEIGLLKLSSR